MQVIERIGRRLKLRDLNIFLAVVKERSMSRAASALAVSQPAVSKSIADIEHLRNLFVAVPYANLEGSKPPVSPFCQADPKLE